MITKSPRSLDTSFVKSGDVPLGIAAQMGHVQTVERLLQAKAIVNYQNKVIQSPDAKERYWPTLTTLTGSLVVLMP